MKKRVIIFMMFFLLVASCMNTDVNGLNKSPLSEFIIGKWTASVQINENGELIELEYQVEFVDRNTVILKMTSTIPSQDINAKFDYSFIDDNNLLVENERSKDGSWIITQLEEDLEICIWSTYNCIRFNRIN